MTDEPIDTDTDEQRKKRTEGESDSSATGFKRANGEGIVARSEEDIEAERKKKKSGEGEGDAGSAVAGYHRASGEGIVLSVDLKKRVWADFRHLDLNEVVAAVAEFFSEFPARASANLAVAWDKGGYAIVNMAIKFGQDVAMAVRERTRESAVQVRKKYGINLKFKNRGGVSTAPGPQGAGLS